MKVTPNLITPAPTLDAFTVVMSPTEAQRLAGIVGETYGRDGDGLYDELKDALDEAGLTPIKPTGTQFKPVGM